MRPNSPAATAGLEVGDIILSVNGHILRDVIDYRFYTADERLSLEVRSRAGDRRALHIRRGYGEDLGLDFSTPTFDGLRRCRNCCEFCFVQQMPPGLRKSLYVKDDDYRHSFLFGNFVTLTNLDDQDWQRLAEQRLSPLYVSVHSTNPALRSRMLGVPDAGDIVAQIQRLGNLGIQVHAQVVLIPGLNDGQALAQTVEDLVRLHPSVASVAVVPVGVTRHQSCGLRPMTAEEAQAVLRFVRPWQRECRRRWGTGFLYPSDELYLLSKARVPAARNYDGFPQLANGVGLVRQLLDDWRRLLTQPASGETLHQALTLVCGTLIAPTLQVMASPLAQCLGAEVLVLPVTNRLFGPTVTVSGLLTGEDVVMALRDHDVAGQVVLPRAMFDESGAVTLDDDSPADIAGRIGADVIVADRLSELVPQTHC